MAHKRAAYWPVIAAVVAAFTLFLSLPDSWKLWAPPFLRSATFHFGLDLAGGTQLDFRISEDEIEEQLATINQRIKDLEQVDAAQVDIDKLRLERQVIEEQRTNMVEAIRTVLERRINSLGVSEATITPSYIGTEKHLLVECPGVVDVQECIETVGKTIQLEFKEEFTQATAEYEAEIRAEVAAARGRMQTSGLTLATLGEDLNDELGVVYEDRHVFFRDQLPKGLETLWTAKPGSSVREIAGSIKTQTQNPQGEAVEEEIPGIFLAEVLGPKTITGRTILEASVAFKHLETTEDNVRYTLLTEQALESAPAVVAGAIRTMQNGELRTVDLDNGSAILVFLRNFFPGQEQAEASHILVSYKGASSAEPTVTRTKDEALARAKELKTRLNGGAAFEDLARRESDGPSKANAGRLPPFGRGTLMPAFEAVAFSSPQGFVSDPLETPFGYHIIRVEKTPVRSPDKASYETLTITGTDAAVRAPALLARLQNGQVQTQEESLPLRFLFFSLKPTGWKDTALDGKHFRTASVTLDPTTNIPVVQIIFDEEGGRLFQELTKRNVGKTIAIFVGGEMISAPMVQQEIIGGTAVITGSRNVDEARLLAQDLNTGAIPAPIHLTGQRTVEPTLGASALTSSVKAALVGIIIVMLYMLLVYRLFGVLANIGLVVYALLFVALMKLPLFLFSSQYIVLTLAGAAGMILSIGMAVDTNVLVFERVKEELKKGKGLKTAVDVGFEKAWPSIRDSNISTIITCALLFIIGTSIVRGFAVTLGLGVVISMFTGMVVSRWLARQLANSNFALKPGLLPAAAPVASNA